LETIEFKEFSFECKFLFSLKFLNITGLDLLNIFSSSIAKDKLSSFGSYILLRLITTFSSELASYASSF